ncbi:MAG: hypothetical protein AAF672_08265, partial [Pseudomonadota bacterium]
MPQDNPAEFNNWCAGLNRRNITIETTCPTRSSILAIPARTIPTAPMREIWVACCPAACQEDISPKDARGLQTAIALIIFLFPIAYSPGSGNLFFAANGARFGFRPALPANAGYHIP